jgi:hypothetical protein
MSSVTTDYVSAEPLIAHRKHKLNNSIQRTLAHISVFLLVRRYYTFEKIKRRCLNKVLHPHRTLIIFHMKKAKGSPAHERVIFSRNVHFILEQTRGFRFPFRCQLFCLWCWLNFLFLLLIYPFCCNLTGYLLVHYPLLALPSAPECIDSTQFRYRQRRPVTNCTLHYITLQQNFLRTGKFLDK